MEELRIVMVGGVAAEAGVSTEGGCGAGSRRKIMVKGRTRAERAAG